MLVIEWFESNYMNLNKDKCHFFLPGYNQEMMLANIWQSKIWKNDKHRQTS